VRCAGLAGALRQAGGCAVPGWRVRCARPAGALRRV